MFNLAYRHVGGERRDILLERLQSGNVLVRQQVSAHTQRLAELDKGRSETRKSETKPLRGR
jgi:hypothetical protein